MEQKIEPFDNYSLFFQQLNIFSQLKKSVVEDNSSSDFFRQLVNFLLELTSSEFALIGLIKNEGANKVLRLADMHDVSWSKEKQSIVDKKIKQGLFIESFAALYDNKPNLTRIAQLIPVDNVKFNNYLAIPLTNKAKNTAVIIIANRVVGFDKHIAEQLNFFTDTINLMLELKKHHSLLHDMVQQDRLTQLHSQTFFEKSMPSIIAYHQHEKKSFCLLLIEISNLKEINQELNESLGDKLLYQFTQRLDLNIKHRNIMVRVSGNKFVIILNDIPDFMTADSVAKRIYKIIASPFFIDDHSITCKYSIGVSCYPEAGQSYEELIKNAESTLYKAKNKSGFQFYSEELDNEFVATTQLEEDLKIALENNELYVVYQPQVHMFTKMVTGFEGLLRWNHPIRGSIPPAIFIPIAIKNGLAEAINLYVLKHTIKDFKSILENKEYPLKISINVSPHVSDFEQHNKALLEVINSSGNTADYFKLEAEITENDFTSNRHGYAEHMKNLMNTLKQSNVSLAIDNFGMKQASISRLLEHHFDVLKIDSHFTQALDKESEKNSKKIISVILDMSKRLNIDVIAKGVETKEQADILMQMGCAKAQGFYYYKPMEIDQVHNLLSKH